MRKERRELSEYLSSLVNDFAEQNKKIKKIKMYLCKGLKDCWQLYVENMYLYCNIFVCN